MAKVKAIYICESCSASHPQWQGQCRECSEWNSLIEKVTAEATASMRPASFAVQQPIPVPLIEIQNEKKPRLSTGFAEFDHVLGGGLVSDSVVLIGGDPGIGKSTLLLQILCQLSRRYSTLYVTGEESLPQISLRAERLGLKDEPLTLLAETRVEQIIEWAEKQLPQIMVIDSIQTTYRDSLTTTPGSVSQVRESAAQLVHFAKHRGIALFLVGHVTKEGGLAGPRVLEHMVDVVLYFEGRDDSRFRVIRAVKNRFGAVNEIGIFAMTAQGLKPVTNPSAIFLSQTKTPISGSAITVTWEGTRPLLVELQALVDETHLANPRRVCVGLESNRLSMLLAILHRHAHIKTYHADVFVNVVGGLQVTETAVDLSLVLAVVSSLNHHPLNNDCVIFGEVGLGGEIRPVPYGQERLKEAVKHGFKRALIPKANAPKDSLGIEIIAVECLQDALNVLA